MYFFLVAVKRIREIMAGADVNVHPPSQPQRMPVSSPMPTPSVSQPLAIFDRQPLPPGVSAIKKLMIETVPVCNSVSDPSCTTFGYHSCQNCVLSVVTY